MPSPRWGGRPRGTHGAAWRVSLCTRPVCEAGARSLLLFVSEELIAIYTLKKINSAHAASLFQSANQTNTTVFPQESELTKGMLGIVKTGCILKFKFSY